MNKYEGYPTKEEYFEKLSNIRNYEIHTDRFKSVYSFLNNNCWNRDNQELENELFKIVGTYGIEDNFIGKSKEYKEESRKHRYNKLKAFMALLTEEQISSNIYLKNAKIFMNTCKEDCFNIINELSNRLDEEELVKLELPIPFETKAYIPDYIKTTIGLKYYRPEAYRISYEKILDNNNSYVYDDFNTYVDKITKLLSDIYLLELNNRLSNMFGIELHHFQIYENNKFLISFYINIKDNNILDSINEEYIEKTVNNFKELLEEGIIDLSVLDENDYVLKK